MKGISVALFLRQIIFHNFDIILLVLKQTGSGISATSRKLGSAFSDMGSQMKNKIMNNNQVKAKDLNSFFHNRFRNGDPKISPRFREVS